MRKTEHCNLKRKLVCLWKWKFSSATLFLEGSQLIFYASKKIVKWKQVKYWSHSLPEIKAKCALRSVSLSSFRMSLSSVLRNSVRLEFMSANSIFFKQVIVSTLSRISFDVNSAIGVDPYITYLNTFSEFDQTSPLCTEA